MDPESLRDILLDITEESLEAQLKAVRRLRGRAAPAPSAEKGLSNIDMVYDVLKRAGGELHIHEILRRVEMIHGVRLGRESVVSAITKKVHQGVRFQRTGKNTFALLPENPS